MPKHAESTSWESEVGSSEGGFLFILNVVLAFPAELL